MIELQNVRKVFNAGKPGEFTALHGVSLRIEPRTITVLKGPSGSGKTSLLSIIGCMSRPTAGRVRFSGRELTSLPERFLTDVRRNTFGFIFQHFHLIKGLTALENVILPAYPAGGRYRDLKQRALGLLDAFGVAGKAHARTEWLSGGETQRVCIARALINMPSVIIADEPTAHLDTKLSREFMATMSRIRGEGRTVLISSHDPSVCDSGEVDRVIHIRDGRVENGAS